MLVRLTSGDGRPSLSALAAGAQRSPWNLHRLVRDVTGEPPARFARRVALDRAAARLLTDDVQVLDVALEAGFESHEGFARAFARRFGVSPSAYRAQGRLSDDQARAEHRRLVGDASPCLQLYRVDQDTKDDGMTAKVELQDIEGFTALIIRRRIPRDAVAETLGECLPKVFGYAQQHGLGLASPPFARYPQVTLGGFVIECGLAIAEPGEAVQPAGDIERLEVGPCRAATAVHQGAYDTLPATYVAIEQWLLAQGMAPGGPAWETYVTDPGEYPDPADWITEVVQPVLV